MMTRIVLIKILRTTGYHAHDNRNGTSRRSGTDDDGYHQDVTRIAVDDPCQRKREWHTESL